LIVNYDESATLRVSAVGSGQLSYQWKKDDQEITDCDHYAGINTAALTISSFSDKCQGDYLCIVKNDNVTIESKHATVELSKSVLICFGE
jgi:predicted lipoprotein with Yx(FWY)xxD motif